MFNLIDLLFLPKNTCYCCKEEETNDYICDDCIKTLETIVDFKTIEGSTCYSPYLYAGHMEKMIKEFKFREQKYYGKLFAKLLADFYISHKLDYDILIPIPLSKEKYLKRGFNQCELICDFLSKRISVPVNKEILFKVKDTKDQHLLSKSERSRNLNSAFEARTRDELLNKKILIVDDLLTSGYTLQEAIVTLKKAGYVNIDALVIGKAKPESIFKSGR